MPTWSREDITTIRTQWRVSAEWPIGACWNQVQQAISLALRELRDEGGHPEGWVPADDAIRIRGDEENIFVFYEREVRT